MKRCPEVQEPLVGLGAETSFEPAVHADVCETSDADFVVAVVVVRDQNSLHVIHKIFTRQK